MLPPETIHTPRQGKDVSHRDLWILLLQSHQSLEQGNLLFWGQGLTRQPGLDHFAATSQCSEDSRASSSPTENKELFREESRLEDCSGRG